MSTDPRRRKSRHELTPDKLSTTIQITEIPQNWNESTVSSVIAGSGPIISITPEVDPRTGRLSSILYDYKTSRDCSDAFDLLSKIDKFPCKIEKTIPTNFKERLESTKVAQELELNRDSFPWDLGLELPFQMVTEIPIPRRPLATSSSSNSSSETVEFPDILSKASQHLPALNADLFETPTDTISKNLSKIPPLQIIEIISNLKILANQNGNTKPQIEKFLMANRDISITVGQALLEMGVIDNNVVTSLLQSSASGSNTNSANQSISATPTQAPIPINSSVTQAPPPPPQQQQQQFVQQQQQFGYQQQHQPPVVQQMHPQQPKIDYNKLQQLPQNQQDMIKQVLTLDDNQITQLPPDQQAMVANLKKEYIIN